MRYALERLSQLVEIVVNVMTGRNEEMMEEFIKEARYEKREIQNYLLRRSLEIKDERAFELLIERYQGEIIRLMDMVWKKKVTLRQSSGQAADTSETQRTQRKEYSLSTSGHCVTTSAGGGQDPRVKVYDALIGDLEALLSHIGDQYSKFFNLDERVPVKHLVIVREELKWKIEDLKNTLGSPGSAAQDPRQTGNDDELIKIVIDPLSEFVERNVIKYRELVYVKELVGEMEKVTESPDFANAKSAPFNKGGMANALLQVLVYMNFNSGQFANYLIRRIVDEINALTERHERLDRLHAYVKEYNQTYIKPGVVFTPHLLCLQEQIVSWITEEIYYLEKKERLLSVAPMVQDEVITDKDRIHFSTSVEVLALLARSAQDSKLILNSDLKNVFQSVSKIVRTKNALHPSGKSMLRKSYIAERNVKKAAINILHEMISKIHGY